MPKLTRPVILAAVLAGLLAALAAPTEATIRKAPGAWRFGPHPLWTDGTSSPFFHPVGDAMPSVGLLKARITYELSQDSGYCELPPAPRWSADGVTWDSPVAILSAYQTTNGITVGTAYTHLMALGTPKSWVQFGIEVANDVGGSGLQFCNGTVLVEPEEA